MQNHEKSGHQACSKSVQFIINCVIMIGIRFFIQILVLQSVRHLLKWQKILSKHRYLPFKTKSENLFNLIIQREYHVTRMILIR